MIFHQDSTMNEVGYITMLYENTNTNVNARESVLLSIYRLLQSRSRYSLPLRYLFNQSVSVTSFVSWEANILVTTSDPFLRPITSTRRSNPSIIPPVLPLPIHSLPLIFSGLSPCHPQFSRSPLISMAEPFSSFHIILIDSHQSLSFSLSHAFSPPGIRTSSIIFYPAFSPPGCRA